MALDGYTTYNHPSCFQQLESSVAAIGETDLSQVAIYCLIVLQNGVASCVVPPPSKFDTHHVTQLPFACPFFSTFFFKTRLYETFHGSCTDLLLLLRWP